MKKSNQWFARIPHFDVCKPHTVQVDASQKGLGAALLQDGCLVAFASKDLTPVEQHYANIECELLTSVFRAECFYTNAFGCAFTIENDHKPLEQINTKIWEMHMFVYRECCYDSKTMMPPSVIDLAKRSWLQMLSLTMHPSKLQRYP